MEAYEQNAVEIANTKPVEAPPEAPGVTERPLELADGIPYHEHRLAKAETLADMAEDYVFFTHGALFCYGRWGRDPVPDHIAAVQGHCEPFFVHLDKPVFKFLDIKDPVTNQVVDDSWNRQICAVHKSQWDELFKFFYSLAGLNRDQKFFHMTVAQKLPIVDVAAMDRMAVLPDSGPPMVDCICLAIVSNRWTAKFAPNYKKLPWDPIPVILGPSDPKVVKYAKAIFKNYAAPIPNMNLRDLPAEQSVDLIKGQVLQAREDLKENEVTPDQRLDMLKEETHAVNPTTTA